MEIGIRMALGANSSDVRRLILRSGLRLALVGAGLGLAGAVAIIRLLGSMMPAIEGGMGNIIAGGMAALAAVALLASYIPAHAASKVDPVTAIRAE
jgi:ABC-type antimicrobial peptide transport system permease subunit